MIALSPSAISSLRKHKEKQEMERLLLGKTLTNEDLVFSYLNGKPLLPNTVTHAWTKLVRNAGLKAILTFPRFIGQQQLESSRYFQHTPWVSGLRVKYEVYLHYNPSASFR